MELSGIGNAMGYDMDGKSGETYYFARDDKGDLYYQSKSGRRFAKEMEEAQKRRVQEKERPRYKKMA